MLLRTGVVGGEYSPSEGCGCKSQHTLTDPHEHTSSRNIASSDHTNSKTTTIIGVGDRTTDLHMLLFRYDSPLNLYQPNVR